MVSAIFWSKDVADSGVYGLLCVFMLPVCPYCVWQRFLYDVAVFMAVYAWAVLLCIVVARVIVVRLHSTVYRVLFSWRAPLGSAG